MIAPARFRRITKRSRITVPCALARKQYGPHGWEVFIAQTEREAEWSDDYTHWMPFDWPEAGR